MQKNTSHKKNTPKQRIDEQARNYKNHDKILLDGTKDG